MKSTAFTVVELLVVIAIISILAAILFPVFARAKEAAKKSVCLSNSRQLSQGVILYSGDSDDVLLPTQNGDHVLWTDLLNPYVKDKHVRICLDDQSASNSYGLNELAFVDFTDNLPLEPTYAPSMSQLQSPSATIMLGELGTEDDLVTPRENAFKLTVPGGDINDQFDARPSARHFSRSNLGFFDGHSMSLRLEQFYINQSPMDKAFCLNPDSVVSCVSRP